jgi:hypothetical protein
MKRHTLVRGIVVAALLAVTGGALHGALTLYFPPAAVLRLTLGLVAAAYVLHIVAYADIRSGRIVVALGWLVCTTLLAVITPPLALFVVIQAMLLWLVRALCCHGSPLPALADFVLSALALAAGIASTRHTGSIMLGLWTVFLVQAFFVVIPQRPHMPAADALEPTLAPLARARAQAQAALRRVHAKL